jgi:hypothetical protein
MWIAWRLSVDQKTGCVEIKRAPLVRLPTVLFGIALGAIAVIGLFIAFSFEPTDDAELSRCRMLVMVCSTPLCSCVFVPLDASTTLINSRYWKGSLRFRFDPQSGELFFPRENVTYGAGDYSKLVLGCVRGTERASPDKFFGMRLTRKKSVAIAKSTQIFMLVLDQNDVWQRYNLADDHNSDSNTWKTSESGNKQFTKLADLLHRHFSFEQFVKDYSKDECYEQQQGTDKV